MIPKFYSHSVAKLLNVIDWKKKFVFFVYTVVCALHPTLHTIFEWISRYLGTDPILQTNLRYLQLVFLRCALLKVSGYLFADVLGETNYWLGEATLKISVLVLIVISESISICMSIFWQPYSSLPYVTLYGRVYRYTCLVHTLAPPSPLPSSAACVPRQLLRGRVCPPALTSPPLSGTPAHQGGGTAHTGTRTWCWRSGMVKMERRQNICFENVAISSTLIQLFFAATLWLYWQLYNGFTW